MGKEIYQISFTPNETEKTDTIVFEVVDKYFKSSQISTTDTSKLTVYVDGEEATYFDPQERGPGIYLITYCYEAPSGCRNMATQRMEVREANEHSLQKGDVNKDEKVDTYILNAGTIFDSESLVNNLNETVGSEMFRTDGVSFYISMAGIEMEVAWYYKDTNTKFDWNKPINSDVEIEMKVLNGFLDNDFFQDINDYFN